MRPLKQVVVVITCALVVLQTVQALNPSRNRNNLFDPIYAYDDIDAHTVSATLTNPRSSQDKQRAQNYQQSLYDNNDDLPLADLPVKTINYSPPSSTTKRQVSTTSTSVTPLFVASTASDSIRAIRKLEQPHHWSALENYYQKLRQPSVVPKSQSPIYQLPIYPDLEEKTLINDRLNQPVLTRFQNPPLITTVNNLETNPFSLPFNNSPKPSTSSGLLPSVDPDFGFSVHYQASPGISRTGTGSLLLPNNKSPIQQQQQVYQSIGGQQQSKSYLPQVAPTDDGTIKYLEWRKLPELLFIQQQQERVKHQQETFGPWYDHQRSRELLQEEAYCGPKNYVKYHLAPTNLQTDSAIRSTLTPAFIAKLKQQLDQRPSSQMEVPVALSAGEYPSHMGVYNDTSAKPENFLCSATYVHERFALTLASCVSSLDPSKLIVRSGEWNLNRNTTESKDQYMIKREVKLVHVFHKYRNNTNEHDLALLEFKEPIEYLEAPFICPACQMQYRSTIRTNSCWAPVRNVTLSEYFDAGGEGETKERRDVGMIEIPVRLIANDDEECYRQTHEEFFNLRHPNYICSADYRRADWRARLNQTEYIGSGIYCNEGGNLSLVSIVHPTRTNSSSTPGFLDLSYYKPWMRKIISGRNY